MALHSQPLCRGLDHRVHLHNHISTNKQRDQRAIDHYRVWLRTSAAGRMGVAASMDMRMELDPATLARGEESGVVTWPVALLATLLGLMGVDTRPN